MFIYTEKRMKKFLLGLTAALVTASAIPAQAQIRITEAAAWGSGNAPYLSDWFELTNFGPLAVNISNWKMDDNSAAFATAVPLTGITSIASGESVIFIENATANAGFLTTWFGVTPPPGLQIGNYTGGGVGLSTTADGVTIFNGSGIQQAIITFGASPGGPSFASFDNAGGLNGVAISTLSAVGVNGAFVAVGDVNEIGSPGRIASVTPVPEPESYALMALGLGLIGMFARKRQVE
jgi:hypothetical protein